MADLSPPCSQVECPGLLCCWTRAKTVCSPAGGGKLSEESAVSILGRPPRSFSSPSSLTSTVHRLLRLRHTLGGSPFSLTEAAETAARVSCTASFARLALFFFALFFEATSREFFSSLRFVQLGWPVYETATHFQLRAECQGSTCTLGAAETRRTRRRQTSTWAGLDAFERRQTTRRTT